MKILIPIVAPLILARFGFGFGFAKLSDFTATVTQKEKERFISELLYLKQEAYKQFNQTLTETLMLNLKK